MGNWLSFWITAAYLALLGVLSYLIGEAIPKSRFHPDRFPFTPRRWEKGGKIYDWFGIRRWKDRVPDMSRVFTKRMIPKRFGKCPNAEECAVLAIETCRAEAVHTVLCFLSIPLIFFWSERQIGVLVMLIDILANLPFIMIQRYNRPALLALEKRLRIREQRRIEKAEGGKAAYVDQDTHSVC